jgi:hypothetical protein
MLQNIFFWGRIFYKKRLNINQFHYTTAELFDQSADIKADIQKNHFLTKAGL